MSNSAFLSFSMQASQPGSSISLMRCRLMLSFALLVMLCSQTIEPNFDRCIEKHAHQNIQNDCQWLSHSFRIHTVLSVSTKNKVVFLRSVCFFSLGQTDGHRYHDSTIPKTSWWIEYCTKFGQFIISKIIAENKLTSDLVHFKAKMHQIRFRLGLRPRLRCGSLQRSPNPLAGFQGAYF